MRENIAMMSSHKAGYCVAYELLLNRKEKKERVKMMSRIICRFLTGKVEKVQMVFSGEAIKKLWEKRAASPETSGWKTPHTCASGKDIIAPVAPPTKYKGGTGRWIFGLRVHCYPYELLRKVLDCLQEMGFVP